MHDLLQPVASPHSTQQIVCWHIIISGYVQGVGFRPFVFRLANELGIMGFIENNAGQVSLVVESNVATLQLFRGKLLQHAPLNARPVIESVTEVKRKSFTDFAIRQSHALQHSDVHILPDLPTCDDCLQELFAKQNRRYHYPFINCTQCGPRYSIIRALPYDRANTSMQNFTLCADCEKEYRAPADRRFHAEPVTCEVCGPRLQYVDATQNIEDNHLALMACVTALQQGKIIAVKGLGGYHLMCDATSSKAIALLRQRKQRPDKPFAILVAEQRLADVGNVTQNELTLLKQNSRPIVLIKRNKNYSLPALLAPGFNRIGVMLPGNPLQHLLCHLFARPMIATSANISGEPIITDNRDATTRLATLCDAFLHHNRDIVRPADDPVMSENAIVNNTTGAQLIRTGRGLAPSEFTLPFTLEKPLLAVGGHIKNTIALAWQNRMVVSAHNGDLGSLRSYQTFQQCIHDLQQLYQVKAEHIICDAHPEYGSTRWAENSGMNVSRIYHHHAHASSLFIDTQTTEKKLVFSWDGIGLGADGTLWGGETFLGQPGNWQRVVSFKPFRLPGGEKTAREAWRVATSLCWQANLDVEIQNQNIDQLKLLWDKQLNSPESSAAGRLFSAGAALLGLVTNESFEGHGPMLLEALAETATADAIDLPVFVDATGTDRIDWQPLVRMLKDNTRTAAQRARCFHESLAECVANISLHYTTLHKNLSVGLSGGVFQNQLLLGLIRQHMEKHAINLILPSGIPVNDGGLCVGQIIEYHYADKSRGVSNS